jgi:hypothetical protein
MTKSIKLKITFGLTFLTILIIGIWILTNTQAFRRAYLQNPIVRDQLLKKTAEKDKTLVAKNTETLNQQLEKVPQGNKDQLQKAVNVVYKELSDTKVIAGSVDIVITNSNTQNPVISVILGSPENNTQYLVYVYTLFGLDGVYVIDAQKSFTTQSVGYTKPELIKILEKTNLVMQPSPDESKLMSKQEQQKITEKNIQEDKLAEDAKNVNIKKRGVDFYQQKIVSGEIKKGQTTKQVVEIITNTKVDADENAGRVLDSYKLLDDKYPQYTYITFEYSVKYIRYDDVKGDINEYSLKSIYFQKIDNIKEYILQ